MANISHFTQTVNGVSTTYDIHDANAVDLTNNQTVGGIKTFSNAPVVNSINLDGKTIDTDANGNMTFNGNELLTSAIKESSINHKSGWCLLHGGLLIQWGTDASSSSPRTINFSKPYSTLPIVTICYGQPDNRSVPCSVNSDSTVTTTSFVAYGPSSFSWRINWIAIGEGA